MKYEKVTRIIVILLAIFNLTFMGLYLNTSNKLHAFINGDFTLTSATGVISNQYTYIHLSDEQINILVNIDPEARLQEDLDKIYIFKVESVLNRHQQNLWLQDFFKNVYNIEVDLDLIYQVREHYSSQDI